MQKMCFKYYICIPNKIMRCLTILKDLHVNCQVYVWVSIVNKTAIYGDIPDICNQNC